MNNKNKFFLLLLLAFGRNHQVLAIEDDWYTINAKHPGNNDPISNPLRKILFPNIESIHEDSKFGIFEERMNIFAKKHYPRSQEDKILTEKHKTREFYKRISLASIGIGFTAITLGLWSCFNHK